MATVRFKFNPFKATGLDKPKGANRTEALEAIRALVEESVLSDVAQARSPVAGHGKFPALSKEYKKIKRASGRSGKPDLEFKGKMLEALDTKVSGNSIILETLGKQGDKADGHCNHSGDSKLPLRRYIPKEKETLKKPIMDGIRRLIREHQEDG